MMQLAAAARMMAAAAAALAALVAGSWSSAEEAVVSSPPATIVIHEAPALPREVQAYRQSLREARPELRGFRAPILKDAATPWPSAFPGSDAPAELREAAAIVNRRLARDGLLITTAAAMSALGAERFAHADDRAMDLLKAAGLPVDLLACFEIAGAPAVELDPARPLVRHVAAQLARGGDESQLQRALAAIPFRFVKSHATFRVATESGEEEIGALRLQLTRGTDWAGIGDGGSLDMMRQLVSALPDAQFVASIERRHLNDFLAAARRWPLNRPGRLVVIPEQLTVAQWAQDNVKSGFIDAEAGASEGAAERRPALLVPRYASRGEDGSTFAPGESFLIDGLASLGTVVIQSPLLFQGGDLMPVRDPRSGQRIMLVGEGEVYRNMTLGLTAEQALEALRVEFGVDRCEVLPAVSFHIDYEVCVRAEGERLIAFVNDTPAALPIIGNCALDALEKSGVLAADAAGRARESLRSGQMQAFLEAVLTPLWARADPRGGFPLALAEAFSAGPSDSGVGNLHRFLLALDMLVSQVYDPAELTADGHAQAYLRSLRRRDADRAALHRHLEKLGFTLALLPSLADADRSINYLNGVHDRKRYIMPAYGGLYQPLDAAAAAAFRRVLGPEVEVIPILCGESQRRVGAVHCSVDVQPRP